MATVSNESQKEFLQSQVGKVFPVLFELENEPDYYHGYTPNYTLVKVPRKNIEKSLRKSIFYVRIEEYKDDYCIGSIVVNN
jgi:threonylcarbamoyladenosine tRNA methylthiotransferase MtaB